MHNDSYCSSSGHSYCLQFSMTVDGLIIIIFGFYCFICSSYFFNGIYPQMTTLFREVFTIHLYISASGWYNSHRKGQSLFVFQVFSHPSLLMGAFQLRLWVPRPSYGLTALPHSLSLFLGLQLHICYIHSLCPMYLLSSVLSLHFFFLRASVVYFSWPVLKSINALFCCIESAIKLSIKFLVSDIIFFQFEVFHRFFFMDSILC